MSAFKYYVNCEDLESQEVCFQLMVNGHNGMNGQDVLLNVVMGLSFGPENVTVQHHQKGASDV